MCNVTLTRLGMLLLVATLLSCDRTAEETTHQAEAPSDRPAASSSDQPEASSQRSPTEGFEIRVTGPYFTGTQSYRLDASQLRGNFFDNATYLKTRSAGSGVSDFLDEGTDGSGLYRLSITVQGSGPGSYSYGNGNEISLYLRNNGEPDPRCKQTAGPCVGVALSMISGTIDIEALSAGDSGHEVRLTFAGSFERTDTPGEGRDTYEVEGEADFVL